MQSWMVWPDGENGVLASRGDGVTGNDISHMMSAGLVVTGEGDGELVMPQAYFDENLSDEFKHPRNVVTGAVGADTVRPAAKQALQDQAIRFVSYSTLGSCIRILKSSLSISMRFVSRF